MLRRQSKNEQFWRWVPSEYSQNELSARQFCCREGLGEGSFYSWKKKIAQRDRLSQPNGDNPVPVHVLPAANSIQSELIPNRTTSVSQERQKDRRNAEETGQKKRGQVQYCSARRLQEEKTPWKSASLAEHGAIVESPCESLSLYSTSAQHQAGLLPKATLRIFQRTLNAA